MALHPFKSPLSLLVSRTPLLPETNCHRPHERLQQCQRRESSAKVCFQAGVLSTFFAVFRSPTYLPPPLLSQDVAHACLRARRCRCRSDAAAARRSGKLVLPIDLALLRRGLRSRKSAAALSLQAHIKDTGGRTALSYAKLNNHKACEDLLPADAPLGRMSATEPSGTSGAGMIGDTEVRRVCCDLAHRLCEVQPLTSFSLKLCHVSPARGCDVCRPVALGIPRCAIRLALSSLLACGI